MSESDCPGFLKDSAVIHCDGGPFFILGPHGQEFLDRLIREEVSNMAKKMPVKKAKGGSKRC